jgi:CRP-like cAMP-binding protein
LQTDGKEPAAIRANVLPYDRYVSVGTLEAGSYFGEYGCLLGEPRTATVVALSFCELYSLSRSNLEEVGEHWPDAILEFEQMLEGYARYRRC